jgi:ABC-type transporter MlaC component
MKLFGLVIVMLLLVLPAAASAAPATRPLAVVAPSDRGADDLFDAGDLARRVLAQHWKALRPEEQDEFVQLFRDVAARSVARVRARTSPEQGAPAPIEYRLSRRDAQWTVHDIVVDGVSLVANYRSQLNSILATSSVAELLERMRTEASRPPPSGEADLEMARERLVAGLLLGAASRARWTR